MAYTRNGQFTINADGQLVTTGSGYVVQPEIVVPKDAVGITVGTDGEVSARIRGQQENQVLGQLTTVDFINPGDWNRLVRTYFYQLVLVVMLRKALQA